jgi:small subunit ribosomal protein S16
MESTSPRDSRAIKELGFYNPISKEVKLDVPNIVKYLKFGAQPTETVKNLLIKAQVLEK